MRWKRHRDGTWWSYCGRFELHPVRVGRARRWVAVRAVFTREHRIAGPGRMAEVKAAVDAVAEPPPALRPLPALEEARALALADQGLRANRRKR